MNDKSTSKPTADEIKQQAKHLGDKLLALASKKYHVDFEIYGWVIALAAVVLLLILVN